MRSADSTNLPLRQMCATTSGGFYRTFRINNEWLTHKRVARRHNHTNFLFDSLNKETETAHNDFTNATFVVLPKTWEH